MMNGFGYEWDAELIGGPADGCIDRVIQIDGQSTPPVFFKKMINDDIKRETLGEKMIEHWATRHIDEKTKVAIYKLRGCPNNIGEDDNGCLYEYVETTTMGNARKKYKFE